MERFKDYLLEKGYAETTSYAYANSINSISEHMTELRGDYVDLYQTNDIPRLIKIRQIYGLDGNHSEFGQRGNGTVRNAMNRYVEFREWENNTQEDDFSFQEEKQEDVGSIQEDMMVTLVSLKMKINEINKNTKLITTIIVGQVIIGGLLIYILFQS